MRVPKVLKLPCGIGIQFRQDIEKLMTKLVTAIPLAFDNEIYFSRAEKLKNQLAQKQESELESITRTAKSGSEFNLDSSREYQFVALNGEEMHTEETFDALSKREQEQFSNTIDELEVSLRNMVRQLTEWEESYSEKIKS